MKCLRCEKELTGNQRKYCCRKCAIKYLNKHRILKRICQTCSREFTTKNYKVRFCSNKCSAQARKKYLTIPDCLDRADRKIDKNLGYVRIYCPMHPKANTWGYVYEHRLIAEFKMGRLLDSKEHVHHKDGCRWNNNPDNLEVMSNQEHGRITQYDNNQNPSTTTSEELKDIIEFYKSKYGVPPRPDMSQMVGTSRLRRKYNRQKLKVKKVKRIKLKIVKPKEIKIPKVICESKLRPTKEILEDLIWKIPATHIAKIYNVSDRSVIKWCRKLNISKPSRGYWRTHPHNIEPLNYVI